jgi:hypothetical protein
MTTFTLSAFAMRGVSSMWQKVALSNAGANHG